jgi:hypothetical protein
MRSEKAENLCRNAKYNHRFVTFKKQEALFAGAQCPHCTTGSHRNPEQAYPPSRNKDNLQQTQNFSKLIGLIRPDDKLSGQSIKVQFYGENQIILHNQRMMKKLIK